MDVGNKGLLSRAALPLRIAASLVVFAGLSGCDPAPQDEGPTEAEEREPEAVPAEALRALDQAPSITPTTDRLAPEPVECGSAQRPGEGTVARAFGNICPYGNPWAPDQAIEVVMHADLASHLCVDTATPCTKIDEAALSVTIRSAIDEFHDNVGAAIRMRWGGVCRDSSGRACGWNENVPGKIMIRADPARTCRGYANAILHDLNGDGDSDSATVTLCTLEDTQAWQSHAGKIGLSLNGVLLHELLHALGLAHPSECGITTRSALGGVWNAHLEGYDIDALLTLYQWRLKTRRTRFEDALQPYTWKAGSEGYGEAHLALSRITACDGPTLGGTHVAFSDVFGRWVRVETYRPDDTWAGNARVVSSEYGTNAHPGIACESFDQLRVFFSRDFGLYDQVYYVQSNDAGQSWSEAVLADDARLLSNQGVDATFDPVSGFYIYTIRSTRNLVGTKVMSPGSTIKFYSKPSSSPLPSLPCTFAGNESACWQTVDTVAVACGDESAGDYNCLVAWTDPDWWRATRYAHARVVEDSSGGHRLELAEVRTHGYTSMGTPDVVWALPGTSEPWRLALFQGGSTAYTWGKSKAIDASWTTQRSFSAGQAIVSPTLGAMSFQTWLFTLPRTVLLTTSTPY